MIIEKVLGLFGVEKWTEITPKVRSECSKSFITIYLKILISLEFYYA
jgi:hypothetical protein